MFFSTHFQFSYWICFIPKINFTVLHQNSFFKKMCSRRLPVERGRVFHNATWWIYFDEDITGIITVIIRTLRANQPSKIYRKTELLLPECCKQSVRALPERSLHFANLTFNSYNLSKRKDLQGWNFVWRKSLPQIDYLACKNFLGCRGPK